MAMVSSRAGASSSSAFVFFFFFSDSMAMAQRSLLQRLPPPSPCLSPWPCAAKMKDPPSLASRPPPFLRSQSRPPRPPPPSNPPSRRSIPPPMRFSARASSTWSTADESPYQILGLEIDADDDGIKSAYRKMAKQYHPDVYDGSVELEEGETPESRFIKIQAAYELLIDKEQRTLYDRDNRTNPLKASKAWIEWIMKKKKAFEQRGDMAVSAWAEQQQRELNLKARRMARLKMDPEEERRILAKEKQASAAHFESTVRRHTLVLKKRDLMRRKRDDGTQKQLVERLLSAEGLELADDDSDNG